VQTFLGVKPTMEALPLMTNHKSSNITKRLLSVEETATLLGISKRTIYNKIGPHAKGKFPVKAKRVGHLVKFDLNDLNDYIEQL
jgi:excisionase family DNA binding protein